MLNPFSEDVQAPLAALAAKLPYMSESFKSRMKRLRLRAGFKSQLEAAEAIGCERGTVGMWEAPSSSVDTVGGEYLMRVATAYKVRPEYINSGEGEDGYPWDSEAAPLSVSRSVRLDPEIVRDIADALSKRYEKAGGFNLATQADEFVRAYELWLGMPDAQQDPEVRKLVIRHADLSQGADHDGQRSKEAKAHGAAGEGVRQGRRNKA